MEAMLYFKKAINLVTIKIIKWGTKKDGGIEYTQDTRDHRHTWRERYYEGIWVDLCNSSLARSLARHDCPLPYDCTPPPPPPIFFDPPGHN